MGDEPGMRMGSLLTDAFRVQVQLCVNLLHVNILKQLDETAKHSGKQEI